MRIAFTYAALNGLDVWGAGVQNAFLQDPCSEKYYTVCGPDFGSCFIGKLAIIVRAAYGLGIIYATAWNIWDMNLVRQTRMCE